MGIEIERKFTVKNKDWMLMSIQKILIHQGYLSIDPERTIRVRIYDRQGKITIKSKNQAGIRAEFEYDIPLDDAIELLETLCLQPQIKKYRHSVPYCGHHWEVDEFLDKNTGLTIAEIELQHVDEQFTKPPWINEDVTNDHRYSNSQLCQQPFQEWKQ